MTMADRIAIMDKGEVIQVAPPQEIYEAPISRFVADFVGSVNLFEGIVEEAGGGHARISAPGGVRIRADDAAEARQGATVWFAIRPEKIAVSREPPADPSFNAVEGEIWDIGYLGDVTVYRVKLDAGPVVQATAMNRARAVEDAPSWHDRVWLTFEADAGLVLTR